MSHPISKDQLSSFLKENQEKTGNPLGILPDMAQEWAIKYGISFDSSSTFIYTGLLYQMMPRAEKYVELIERVERSAVLSFGLRFLGTDIASAIASRIGREDEAKVERNNRIIANASILLKKNGIEHSYLAKDEPYSGILFYELGMIDQFVKQAELVSRVFKQRGVKKIITIDPHSTYALKFLYPKFISGFDVEVNHYLEVVRPIAKSSINTKMVVHDPCILARKLNLYDEYRSFLKDAGVEILEPERSKRMTFCCGGPIESIAPLVSNKISESRCNQLGKKCDKAVAACPICLSNLSRCSANSKNDALQVYDALEMLEFG